VPDTACGDDQGFVATNGQPRMRREKIIHLKGNAQGGGQKMLFEIIINVES
jgi:hypothetical protein